MRFTDSLVNTFTKRTADRRPCRLWERARFRLPRGQRLFLYDCEQQWLSRRLQQSSGAAASSRLPMCRTLWSADASARTLSTMPCIHVPTLTPDIIPSLCFRAPKSDDSALLNPKHTGAGGAESHGAGAMGRDRRRIFFSCAGFDSCNRWVGLGFRI